MSASNKPDHQPGVPCDAPLNSDGQSSRQPETWREAYEIPVEPAREVIVLGAGMAGVGAALAAARAGRRVLLIEQGFLPGGQATAGLVVHYLPICDGCGRKVTGGIAEELLLLAARAARGTVPAEWAEPNPKKGLGARYQTHYSPAEYMLALDRVLAEAGVEILYGTKFSRAVIHDGRVQAVVLEEANYRRALYPAAAFVDATGEAALMAAAGAPTVWGLNRPGMWTLVVDPGETRFGHGAWPGVRVQAMGRAPTGTDESEGAADAGPIDNIRKLTDFVLASRQLMRQPAHSQKHIVAVPSWPDVRKMRRIEGEYTLQPGDVGRSFPDSIGLISDWRRNGQVYEVPFRCLYSPRLSNVLAAGRCAATAGDAWEVARCIPQAVLTGQAAGTAAAMLAATRTTLSALKPEELQSRLVAAGVIMHHPSQP